MVKTVVDGHQKKKVVSAQFNAYKAESKRLDTQTDYESFQDSVPATMETTVDSNPGMFPTFSPDTISTHRGIRNKIDDVPVIVEKGGVKPPEMHNHENHNRPMSDDYFDDTYRPVPAGAMITTGTSSVCTGGVPAYDFQNDRVIYLTAGHCVDESTGVEVEQVYQDIGETGRAEYTKKTGFLGVLKEVFDAAEVILDSGIETRNEIVSPGLLDPIPIHGYLSSSAIRDMEGDSSNLMALQGKSTGRSLGKVSDVSVSDGFFFTKADRSSGDSGGPHFSYDYQEGGAYIGGIHQGSAPHTDSAVATAFTKISYDWGILVPA